MTRSSVCLWFGLFFTQFQSFESFRRRRCSHVSQHPDACRCLLTAVTGVSQEVTALPQPAGVTLTFITDSGHARTTPQQPEARGHETIVDGTPTAEDTSGFFLNSQNNKCAAFVSVSHHLISLCWPPAVSLNTLPVRRYDRTVRSLVSHKASC